MSEVTLLRIAILVAGLILVGAIVLLAIINLFRRGAAR